MIQNNNAIFWIISLNSGRLFLCEQTARSDDDARIEKRFEGSCRGYEEQGEKGKWRLFFLNNVPTFQALAEFYKVDVEMIDQMLKDEETKHLKEEFEANEEEMEDSKEEEEIRQVTR